MNDSAPQPALDSATAAAVTSGATSGAGTVPHAQFVTWLRDVAPYVHAHRGKTFVVGVGGELIAAGRLTALVQDVSLLYAMGIRVVLVYGSRPQVQEQLRLKGLTSSFGQGVRITDPAALECVKEAAGEIRLDIEAAFSQGLPNTPMANSKVRVISGNFITARPMGIIDGVDFQHTGVVRKVDAEALRFTLANNALVLISPLGFSPTGEAFNLTFEDVATSVASALKAEKLILLAKEDGVRTVDGELRTEITVPEAERLIEAHEIAEDGLDELRFLLRACNTGVKRGHLLPFGLDGSLLIELFTRDGVGTMVASENLEALREATLDDVGGLIKLLEPLEADGTLVKRPRELIEREIDHFTVLEHDGFIFGCAALYPFPQAKMGELACLTVHRQYREYGDGERLMKRIEARARAAGLSKLFVLTTRTAHWFLKRGFSIANVEHLPIERQQLYNWQRRSQVLVKTL
jgi:amino-acid N-acetyltransferase